MKTKLLENIQVTSTGRRVHIQNPIEAISYSIREPEAFNLSKGIAKEHRIEVRLGATHLIMEEDLQASKELADAVIAESKRLIGRIIAQHVYGEVRTKLYDLAMELRRREPMYANLDPALVLINELLDMTEY